MIPICVCSPPQPHPYKPSSPQLSYHDACRPPPRRAGPTQPRHPIPQLVQAPRLWHEITRACARMAAWTRASREPARESVGLGALADLRRLSDRISISLAPIIPPGNLGNETANRIQYTMSRKRPPVTVSYFISYPPRRPGQAYPHRRDSENGYIPLSPISSCHRHASSRIVPSP